MRVPAVVTAALVGAAIACSTAPSPTPIAPLTAVQQAQTAVAQVQSAPGPATPSPQRLDAEIIRRTLDGRLKISPDGTMRESGRYLLVGRQGADRPDPTSRREQIGVEDGAGSRAGAAPS